ncbi:growth hormone-regulated TBC protein 1-A [Condylostylus longicornis]|uniref:growth hormone-regulated TBC protein 1-A n=1 Tax=Condylostylus longicornis TaxID=2530218 RepID=UPI00244E3DC1|nr:growth hormone-regulated TBC protein 1-A [Condylostylus longicornis]
MKSQSEAEEPDSKFSDIDEYGFKRSENFDVKIYQKFMSSYINVLARRRVKWDYLIRTGIDYVNINSQLKRFIRKGIPAPYRPDVWMKTSGAHNLKKNSPNLYQNLLRGHYEKEIGDSILIDLPRTFPDNIYFETKKTKLFNVLMAYAHHNREVGYCQGLNYIAGLLMIVTDDEETTFWLLKIVVEHICPEYHTKNMANLLRDLAVFKRLVTRRYPEINRKFEQLSLPYAVIASKWFICVFAEVLPVETVLRIWDCVFAEGYKILFRVALALILTHKTAIIKCEEISAAANLFRVEMPIDEIATNCHTFMETVFQIKLKRSELESLRKQCVGITST